MKDVADIKNLIEKHNRLTSEFMAIKYDSTNVALIRYKKFIDSEETIQSILSNIVMKAKDAPDLFATTENQFGFHYETDEIDNLAILYKHLSFLVDNNVDLPSYSLKNNCRKYKKINEMIFNLLKDYVLPISAYISEQLKQMFNKLDMQEKNIYNGDVVYGIQQKDNDKAVAKNVGNNKFKTTFNFNTGSFLLGILSAVTSGLIVWGITELIMFLISK